MSILKVENLNIDYDGRIVASNINFTVDRGDYLVILGRNGAGKSSVLKSVLGLKRYEKGNISWEEENNNYRTGYIAQQTDIMKDFPASVQEVVLSGCLNRLGCYPFYRKRDRELAVENMEKLGISHISKSCFRELSGGQRQRVLLARALCASDRILFLDEPTASLDPNGIRDIYKIIESINRDGTAIVMVSHDMNACDYASHVLHMGEHMSFYGKKEDYIASSLYRDYVKKEEM